MAADPTDLQRLAELLDKESNFEFVADAITASRDRAPRDPGDRDSGQVLEDVIAQLRAAAEPAAP